MDTSDRIAAFFILVIGAAVAALLLLRSGSGDELIDSTTEVLGQTDTRSGDVSEASDDVGDRSAPATTATTTAATAPTTIEDDQSVPDLSAADPTMAPIEPYGVYRDGKVVLMGSVPDAELAAEYAGRAASVLGEENVTVEMTIDPRVQADTMTIDIDERFRFPSGRLDFAPEFEALLNLGSAALQLLPETTLVVTGHTDDVGTEATNLALSQARAQVVVDFMVAQGIPPERVVARGAGESEPVADNATPEGREANRRIEAVLEGVTPG